MKIVFLVTAVPDSILTGLIEDVIKKIVTMVTFLVTLTAYVLNNI